MEIYTGHVNRTSPKCTEALRKSWRVLLTILRGHPDLLKTRFKKRKEKKQNKTLFTLDNARTNSN